MYLRIDVAPLRGALREVLRLVVAIVASAAMSASAQVSDSTAPVLQSISLSPTSVDPSTGGKTVTATARIIDELSGVNAERSGEELRCGTASLLLTTAAMIADKPKKPAKGGAGAGWPAAWATWGTWTTDPVTPEHTKARIARAIRAFVHLGPPSGSRSTSASRRGA